MTAHVVEPPGVPKKHFRADIQGLRAVAVLLVLFDHLLGEPVGGFIGVDVFFVISGFLITSVLLREGERSGTVSIREFYARRARRILPVSVVVLVATVAASYLILLSSRAEQTLQDGLWAAGFLANVHFTEVGTDYFAQGTPPSPMQHYWSLAVEEQFYVVWPLLLLLLFLAGRRSRVFSRRATIAVLASVIAAVSFAWSLHLTDTAPTDAYFSTLTRAWELSIGALLALVQVRLLRVPELLRTGLAWIGLAGIGISSVVISDTTPFPGTAALLPVLSTAVLLAAGNPRGGPGATLVLNNPVMQYVGDISYSLYMWHWPCIVLATAYFGTGDVPFYVAGGVLPVMLAVLSFHALEEPVRRSLWLSPKPVGYRRMSWGQWYRDNRRGLDIALIGSALTAFFLVGWMESTDEGSATTARTPLPVATESDAPGLTPQQALVAAGLQATEFGELDPSLDDLPGAVAPEWKPDGCINVTERNVDRCVYGDRTGSRTAVVLGDSIAVSWMPALRAALPAGWRIQMLTLGECPAVDLPTWRNERSREQVFEACVAHRAWAIDQVERLRPDLVVLSSQPGFANRIVGIGPTDDGRNYAEWERGTASMITSITPHAQRVVVLGPPPSSGNLQTCVTARSDPADCARRLSGHWQRVSAAERSAADAASADYVDPVSWFCFDGLCPAVIDDTPVMWDGSHITEAYSRKLGSLLRPLLLGTQQP